ncbi:MAG: hypothetical protein VR65_25910 [Desulfobulbaceae bacterium BRH_c16a]|nr:MAG: hypothetical protein VR65_25910 [Desulfobulbaceae bacterium BRH_c16a]
MLQEHPGLDEVECSSILVVITITAGRLRFGSYTTCLQTYHTTLMEIQKIRGRPPFLKMLSLLFLFINIFDENFPLVYPRDITR